MVEEGPPRGNRADDRCCRAPFSRGSNGHYYIGFLHKPDELEARLEVGDRLKVNFETDVYLEDECWNAHLIEALPCAPLGDVCLAVFRSRVIAGGAYDPRKIEALPADISGFAEAFRQIQTAKFYHVGIDIIQNDKTFKRQIVGPPDDEFKRLVMAQMDAQNQKIDALIEAIAHPWNCLFGPPKGPYPSKSFRR